MEQLKYIQEYLKGKDDEFDRTDAKQIKLVRHADSRTKVSKGQTQELFIHGKPFPSNIRSLYSLYLYRKELFLKYQGEQALKTYKDIKYIVSFIGEQGTTARFVGVYRVNGYTVSPYNPNEVLFDLQPLSAFESLEETLIIDWGKATTCWNQYYNNLKPVVRVEKKIVIDNKLPNSDNFKDEVFSYPVLKHIVQNPEWVDKLKSVNCIYAILDTKTGKLYVGSTYNLDGILGRWEKYAQTGHGDDKDLKALIAKDPSYAANNFQWTILELLDLNIKQKMAIDRENIWKIKLGSRITGYCNN